MRQLKRFPSRYQYLSRVAGALLAALTVGSVCIWPSLASAQLFAHRTLIAVPLDDSTRPIGLLPSISYLVDVERGWGSAGDDRAWSARLAGTIELWRFSTRTAVVLSTADELAANSLKDNGFNPRGITWELSIGAAHRFDALTAQLDFGHYCKHAIDSADPPGSEHYLPDYVATQRTASLWGPRLRLVSRQIHAGKRLRLRASVGGERYQNQWDGRIPSEVPPSTAATRSWIDAKASAFGALRLELNATRSTNFFLRASGREVFFGTGEQNSQSATSRSNYRIELGWHARGSDGALEFYGAVEDVFDDLGTVTPRQSRVAGLGLRVSNLRHF